MSKSNRRIHSVTAFGWLAVLCLWSAGAALAQTPPVEVEPYVYPYSFASYVSVEHPDSDEYWADISNVGDWGALSEQGITWDEASGVSTVATTLIWSLGGTPRTFNTNSFTWTYQLEPNGNWISWGTGPDGMSFTNNPGDPPAWWIQQKRAKQTSHTDKKPYQLQDESFVNAVVTTTNDTKIKLYSGISTDTTRPHLIRLNVKVWNGTDASNETLIPPSAVRVLTQTPDTENNVFIVRGDDIREDVSPTLVGVANNDIKFDVVPERLKLRFYAQSGKMIQGYDPRPGTKEDHWTSMILGGTNEVTELRLGADWATNKVKIKITGPISVLTAGVPISPTSDFTTNTVPLTIINTGPGAHATIEVQDKASSTTLALLNVRILPLRTVPVGIFRVTDPDSVGTELVGTDANETILGELNSIFLQAGVQFTDESLNFHDGQYANGVSLGYDKQPKDGLMAFTNEIEKDVIASWVNSVVNGGLLPIMLVRKWDGTYADANMPAQIRFFRGNTFQVPDWSSVFTEPSSGIQSLVGAHEVGHFLNLHHWPADVVAPDFSWPQDNGIAVEHLMRPGAPWFWPTDPNADKSDTSNWVVPFPGRWLHKEAWDLVNAAAAQFSP